MATRDSSRMPSATQPTPPQEDFVAESVPPGRVAVVVASRHGATFGIADAIRCELEAEGIDARLFVADSFETFEGADAVVLGSAVYMGHWLSSAESLLNECASELSAKPVWLFSSDSVGEDADQEPAAPESVERAAKRIRARGNKVFAGTVDRGELNFGERLILSARRVKDDGARDWDEIADWTREIASDLRNAEVALAQ